MERILRRLDAHNLVQVEDDFISLTAHGENRARSFRRTQLANETVAE